MQDANQLPDDGSGDMRVWLEGVKSDRGNDRKEYLSTQPDDEGQRKQRAKKSLHEDSLQGTVVSDQSRRANQRLPNVLGRLF